MRRVTAISAACGLLFSVWFANWLVNRYGPIRVWPTDLYAPAGVYVIGVCFILRDTIQRFSGQFLAILAIAAGAGLSAIVSTGLAEASAAGFAASELSGLACFWIMRGNSAGKVGLGLAIATSSAVAAAIDSYVFLSLAPFPHALDFFDGQLVAKLSVTVLAIPFVMLARRRFPVAETA